MFIFRGVAEQKKTFHTLLKRRFFFRDLPGFGHAGAVLPESAAGDGGWIDKLIQVEITWIHVNLVGGWTTPIEKYARQIGNLPQVWGWKYKYLKPPSRVPITP